MKEISRIFYLLVLVEDDANKDISWGTSNVFLPVSLDNLKNATEFRLRGFYLQLLNSPCTILLHEFVLVVKIDVVFSHLFNLLFIHHKLVVVVLEFVN